MERPGWFERACARPGDTGAALSPKEYDYYGAYAEEGSGWRLTDGVCHVPKVCHLPKENKLSFPCTAIPKLW